jgi:signal transduction histidine kinase
LAPVGRDADLLKSLAEANGIAAVALPDAPSLAEAIKGGVGAVAITEEALYLPNSQALAHAVSSQPSWSDIPFVVLTSRVGADVRMKTTMDLVKSLPNATLVERPVRPVTILATLEAALRDRRRQYEVRDTLEALRQSEGALRALNADLEERVAERTEKLQAAVRELEGFTYSVSHDMRAPLRAMVGHSKILVEDFSDQIPEEGRDGLRRISAAASKMALLVEDLLKFARLGRREVVRQPVDLGELVHEVVKDVREEEACEVDLSVGKDLVVQADRELVRMVLHNLIHNACKYRSRTRPLRLEFGSAPEGGETALYLRDNGIGFDMQYGGKLFQPFERLHRDAEYPGTGIGLANVKRIVERHGGRVWAEGAVDEGATFWFTLG